MNPIAELFAQLMVALDPRSRMQQRFDDAHQFYDSPPQSADTLIPRLENVARGGRSWQATPGTKLQGNPQTKTDRLPFPPAGR